MLLDMGKRKSRLQCKMCVDELGARSASNVSLPPYDEIPKGVSADEIIRCPSQPLSIMHMEIMRICRRAHLAPPNPSNHWTYLYQSRDKVDVC